MARTKHKVHSRKDFINKPFHHSDASIFSSIDIKGVDEEHDSPYSEVNLQLRDCTKKIWLNLDIDSEEEAENSLFKVQAMIDHLEELKVKLAEARALYIKEEENGKQLREAKATSKVQSGGTAEEGLLPYPGTPPSQRQPGNA